MLVTKVGLKLQAQKILLAQEQNHPSFRRDQILESKIKGRIEGLQVALHIVYEVQGSDTDSLLLK